MSLCIDMDDPFKNGGCERSSRTLIQGKVQTVLILFHCTTEGHPNLLIQKITGRFE